MSRHPEVKWAQRLDKVYITVQLPDAKTPKVNLEPDGVFTFSATAGAENHFYELKLDLFDKVNVECLSGGGGMYGNRKVCGFKDKASNGLHREPQGYQVVILNMGNLKTQESKINYGVRSIFCVLVKAEKGWWKKLLRGDDKVPHYAKVDWDKWVDEDDDDGATEDFDLGGMDFSKFGGMAGMGDGMGDDFDESDDEDQEAEKAETAGKAEAAEKADAAVPQAKTEAAPST